MKAVFGYIDTFSSRIREMEQQKRDGVTCKKEDKPRSLENFLSRWHRSSNGDMTCKETIIEQGLI